MNGHHISWVETVSVVVEVVGVLASRVMVVVLHRRVVMRVKASRPPETVRALPRVDDARIVVAPVEPTPTIAMMGMVLKGSRALESPRHRQKPVEGRPICHGT